MLLAARIPCRTTVVLLAGWWACLVAGPVPAGIAEEFDYRTAPSRLQPATGDGSSLSLIGYQDQTAAQPPAGQANQPAPRSPAANQQQAANRANQPSSANDLSSSQGSARSPQSRAPYMIGDFFGGAPIQVIVFPPAQTINTSFQGFGTPTIPDDVDAPIAFSLSSNGPVLFTSLVPGSDVSGDGFPDTYSVPPPPPQLTPIPPGQGQLTFNNGVLTFTQGTGSAVDGFPFTGGSTGPPQGADFQLALQHTFQPEQILVSVPNPGNGGGVGRVKISENASPLPRDRVFHNFSYFQGVPLTTSGVNVSRFVPGFEKTLFGGIASVEMRFPMAVTLDNNVLADGLTSTDEVLFGNISIPLKVLLYNNGIWALAGGVQFTVPTADDTGVFLSNGMQLIRIQNRSVHVMPFLGALFTPNDRLFAQGFFQIDAEAKSNPVSVNDGTGALVPLGNLEDQTLMYIDVGLGYWLYQNENASLLTGIAPIVEMHVNQSIDDAKLLNAGSFLVGNLRSNITSTNFVFGTNLQFGANTSLTLGYATPLSDNVVDFDGELRVLFNHRFGPSTRASRAQF